MSADLANPFLGLVPFASGDPLFARDRDVELIQSRIWSSRVTVLFAGSGVGKSSFLNAKLIGALREWFGAKYVVSPGAECWAREDPHQAFIAVKQALCDLPATRNGGIIVLDQFEEVFQYFPSPAALRSFGEALAEVVDEQRPQNIRLLVSIREEFLAQLTALDDFIPGVLTNYYRLRKFTKKQARFVIESTARLRGIETGDRIDRLLADLATVEHGNRSASGLFVDPPYLQIVCHRMWDRESPQPGQAFLRTYEEGAARMELEAYCREKLNTQLSQRQRFLVRRALEHLTGPHEAKKFVRVSELARELGHRDSERLTAALRPLAASDVRILREWTEHRRERGEDVSDGCAPAPAAVAERRQVYQLYHDMYAPMLWRWKEEQAKAERQWTILKSAVAGTLAAVILVFGVLAPGLRWWFVGRPDIAQPVYGSADQMAGILEMRAAFARTLIFRPIGDLLLRRYVDKLATTAAMRMDTDQAISYRLMALAASGSEETDAATRALGPADDLLATHDVNGSVADAVLTRTAEGDVLLVATLNGEFFFKPLQSKAPARIRFAPTKILALSPSGLYAIAADGSGREMTFSRFEVARASASPTPRGRHSEVTSESISMGTGLRKPEFADLQDIGTVIGSFSDDERRAVVIFKGEVLVMEAVPGAEWRQWTAVLPRQNLDITRAAIVGDWLAMSSRDLTELVPVDRITRWNLSSDPSRPIDVRQDCVLPPAVRLIVRKDGTVLARCGEAARWSWVPPDNGTPTAAFAEVTVERAVALDGEASGASASFAGLFPQALDEEAGLLASLDHEGRLLFSALDQSISIDYVLPISERRRFPATENGLRRFGSNPSAFVRRGTLVTIDQNTVRVWKTDAVKDRLQMNRVDYVDNRPPSVDCTIADNGSTVVTAGGRWKLSAPAPDSNCWARDSADRSRTLVFLSDRIEYRAPGSSTLVLLPGALRATFGPGDGKLSILTAGVASKFVILRPLDMGALEEQWSVSCNNCRLVRAADEDGVVVHSDFWIFRISEADSLVGAPKKAWPHVETVFWGGHIKDLRPSDPSNTQQLRVNGATTIDFRKEAVRQRGYSLGWRSILTRPWKTAATLNYECRAERGELVTRSVDALCDWEHRSKGAASAGETGRSASIEMPGDIARQASSRRFTESRRANAR